MSDELLIKYEKELELRFGFQNENEHLKEYIAELEKANEKLTVIATNFQTGINMVRNLDTGTAWVSKRPPYKEQLNAWTPIHRAEKLFKGGDV